MGSLKTSTLDITQGPISYLYAGHKESLPYFCIDYFYVPQCLKIIYTFLELSTKNFPLKMNKNIARSTGSQDHTLMKNDRSILIKFNLLGESETRNFDAKTVWHSMDRTGFGEQNRIVPIVML